jgi:hypothetical protein
MVMQNPFAVINAKAFPNGVVRIVSNEYLRTISEDLIAA